MTDIRIRDYDGQDADNLNRIAVSAFEQFRDHYQDWPAMRAGLAKTAALNATGDLIVVECEGRLAGGVACRHCPPHESDHDDCPGHVSQDGICQGCRRPADLRRGVFRLHQSAVSPDALSFD
jgi:hypothetical protein